MPELQQTLLQHTKKKSKQRFHHPAHLCLKELMLQEANADRQ
jgi:hypothetical protein